MNGIFQMQGGITIYAPVIYTAPCIMFWMHAYTLCGEVGGGWALEFPTFLGPVKWERADRRVPFQRLKMELWRTLIVAMANHRYLRNKYFTSSSFLR
jgi:hypothetical protein